MNYETKLQTAPAASFAETALRLGGKSEDEARRTGAIDSADDQVETLFSAQHQTAASPIHRAIWDRHVPTELFESSGGTPNEEVASVINQSLATVRFHIDSGTLLDEHGKISSQVMRDLGRAGYWGMLVSPEYGGSGASMQQFSRMITMMATQEPTVAGLASVHGCIGAVDPVRSFGDEHQRERFLPKLASGEALSAFALTEPGAGSDLTALRTTAVLDGDEYVVNGEKLFITNAVPGRTIGLVCKIDGKPSVLIVDLPDHESETFQMNRYGLYALRRAHNNGLVFRNFRVPAENLLIPKTGDGLTIAYHGLNLGRVALCANAAGTMRWMLAEMLPWAQYRKTYGEMIAKRELVQRRVGRLAGMIVACDALTQWCAGLLDQGYRGEMECIVAKVFGSETQKTAAIELYMKTHGGRSFLHGHGFGDNVHEFLAPCIYEGEGEMLGMALFKSLVKHHGKQFFEPIGQILHDKSIRKPNLINPMHLWALRKPMVAYAGWYASQLVLPTRWSELQGMSINSNATPKERIANRNRLLRHMRFAQKQLSAARLMISTVMRTHQLKLADRQCRMSAISAQVIDSVVMLVTSLHGLRSSDVVTQEAADCACRELQTRLTYKPTSDADYRQMTALGETIAREGWNEISGASAANIMMPYSQSS
jgi:alkylation response protein AidB-like acyl-CoA dehydrogenase